jgi:hypothetical protein
MAGVDRLPNVLEQLGVGDLLDAQLVFVQVDDARVEDGLGQGEEGIEPVVARGVQPDLLVAVQLDPLLLREGAPPVIGPAHVVVAVHLEQVAQALVDRQAPHHKPRIVFDGQHLFRITVGLDQPLGGEAEGELLDVPLHVGRQGVVHVEADLADLIEAQVAAGEDAAPGGEGVGLAARLGVQRDHRLRR